jgi:hypothetical protein
MSCPRFQYETVSLEASLAVHGRSSRIGFSEVAPEGIDPRNPSPLGDPRTDRPPGKLRPSFLINGHPVAPVTNRSFPPDGTQARRSLPVQASHRVGAQSRVQSPPTASSTAHSLSKRGYAKCQLTKGVSSGTASKARMYERRVSR